MSRLQEHQQPHQEGLALCHRVTLDSMAHRWVLARTPTVHRCPTGKAVGGPQPVPRDNSRQTTTRQRQALSPTCDTTPGVIIHLESYVVAEQRDDHMADESKWRRRGSPRRSRREMKPITQEKINQETQHTKRNEIKHIMIHQNQYTAKVVDVTVVVQEPVFSDSNDAQKDLEKET